MNNQQYFFLDTGKDSNIVIYGAGILGRYFYKLITEAGGYVKFFIDKNVENIKPEGIPIKSMEMLLVDIEDVVIISLQNALLHEEVAKDLHKIGYQKIVYIPINTEISKDMTRYMFNSYYKLYLKEEQHLKFPYYICLNDLANSDNYILEDFKEILIISIPIDLLFTCKKEIPDREHPFSVYYIENILPEKKYFFFDNNISTASMYFKLLDFLAGYSGICEELRGYLEVNTPQKYKNNVEEFLEDRLELFQLYERKFSEGMDFFINSAPPVCYNEKGYVNLMDGHHRCCYLVHKGLRYIPVRILREDFCKLLAEDKSVELVNYLKRVSVIGQPLEYIGAKVFWNDDHTKYREIAICIARYLSDIPIRGSFLCQGTCSSYVARWMYRMGFAENIAIVPEKDKRLAELTNYVLTGGTIDIVDKYHNYGKPLNFCLLEDVELFDEFYNYANYIFLILNKSDIERFSGFSDKVDILMENKENRDSLILILIKK